MPARRRTVVTAAAPAAWGTSYLATSALLPADEPLWSTVLRALPAGLVLLAVRRTPPHRGGRTRVVVLAMLNVALLFGLLFVASQRLPGAVVSALGAAQPLLVAGFGGLLLAHRPGRRPVACGLAGLVGVALLVGPGAGALSSSTTIGLAAGLGSATAMACGTVLTARWSIPTEPLTQVSWQLTAGGLLLLPLAAAVEGVPAAPSLANVVGLLWLGGVATAGAYAVWFRGIAELGVTTVSSLALVSPVVATGTGWLLADQPMGPRELFGLAIVLVAMAGGTVGQDVRSGHPGAPGSAAALGQLPGARTAGPRRWRR